MKCFSPVRRILSRIAFFSFAISVLIAVALLARYLPPPDAQAMDLCVPSLIGTIYGEHDAIWEDGTFRVTLQYRTDDAPAGTVLSQSPAPHAVRRVVAGKRPCELTLTLSTGVCTVALPNLIGLDADAAALRLGEMGLRVVRQAQQRADFSPGQVIAMQPPAGTLCRREDTVTLTVSATQTQRTLRVPDVTALPREVAVAALQRAGFRVREISYRPDLAPAGTVLAQFPLGGTTVTTSLHDATLILSDGSLQPTPPANAAEDELQKESD